MHLLAETVSIDGGILVIGLIVLILALVALVALVVAGFRLAPRAGRGESPAWKFAVVVGAEALLLLSAIQRFEEAQVVLAVALIIQVWLFISSRRATA